MDNQLITFNKTLTTIKAEHELPPHISFDQYRHGLITYLLLTVGLHYKLIAARTGHSNPMMILNTYSVVTNEMQREAFKNVQMR